MAAASVLAQPAAAQGFASDASKRLDDDADDARDVDVRRVTGFGLVGQREWLLQDEFARHAW